MVTQSIFRYLEPLRCDSRVWLHRDGRTDILVAHAALNYVARPKIRWTNIYFVGDWMILSRDRRRQTFASEKSVADDTCTPGCALFLPRTHCIRYERGTVCATAIPSVRHSVICVNKTKHIRLVSGAEATLRLPYGVRSFDYPQIKVRPRPYFTMNLP